MTLMSRVVFVVALVTGSMSGLVQSLWDELVPVDQTVETSILALDCESDPGRLSIARGEFPADCQFQGGVAVTVHAPALDWSGRCDTGADGFCRLMTPAGAEIEAVAHVATVTPGYFPRDQVVRTITFGEFSSAIIVNLPLDGAPTERQTLAVYAQICQDAAAALNACATTPGANILIDGRIDNEPATISPPLATNADGWVSFDIAPWTPTTALLALYPASFNGLSVYPALMTCTALDDGAQLAVEPRPYTNRAAPHVAIEVTSGSDIRCDLTYRP